MTRAYSGASVTAETAEAEVERLRGLIIVHRDTLDRQALGFGDRDRDDVDNDLYNAALSDPQEQVNPREGE